MKPIGLVVLALPCLLYALAVCVATVLRRVEATGTEAEAAAD